MNRDLYPEKIAYMTENEFRELSPQEYYRMMFPLNSFQEKGENNGDFKPNGLIQYHCPDFRTDALCTNVIFDDHKCIRECIEKTGRLRNADFSLISGCSFIGKSKSNKNARYCHAIIFDLDEVDVKCLENLIGMTGAKLIPLPTAISISGNGVHICYMLDIPIRLTAKNREMLTDLKALLTRKLWNEKTSKDPNVQYQGIVQGYRTVGTQTKRGHIVRAFQIGGKISIEELINSAEELNIAPFHRNSNGEYYTERIRSILKDKRYLDKMKDSLVYEDCTMQELREENPEWFENWYQRRVIEKQKPGHIDIGRKSYDKWLSLIKEQAQEGNRRRCIYCLAAWAQKCGISEEEFVSDAYSLIPHFESLTTSADNHFTRSNVDSIIAQFKTHDYTRMTIRTMERMTGLVYPREKKKKQDRAGRPAKEDAVKEYIRQHPEETNISLIARECGVTRPTVYKYFAS